MSASYDFPDQHQLGLQFFQPLNSSARRVALGYRKVVNRDLTIKAKVDTNLNANLFTDYRLGNGFGIQGTVGGSFNESNKTVGFLDSGISLGVKVKYDS